MKFTFILLFFCSFLYSQDITEKWNDYRKQYEYFDSTGKMVAYKIYDSYKKQWETYTVKSNNTPNKNEESAVDILGKAATVKQARYNTNHKKIQTYIDDCYALLDSGDDSKDLILIKNIKNSFNENYIIPLGKKSADLSSERLTNEIIQWLKNGFLSTIDIETKKRNIEKAKEGTVVNLTKYYGGYKVSVINEYVLENGQYRLLKTEHVGNSFYFNGDFVYFKRGQNADWLGRKITYKMFNSYMNTHSYNTDYGSVFIDKDFKYIIMLDETNPVGGKTRKYEYIIGDYDKNIIPN